MNTRLMEGSAASSDCSAWPLDDIEAHVLYVQRDELAVGEWNHVRLTNGHWRLYHNDSDGATLIVDGVDIALRSGVVYLIPPGLTMSCRNRSAFAQVFIHFDMISTLPLVLIELFPSVMEIPAIEGFPQAMVELGRRVTKSGFPDLAVECMAKAMVYQALAQCLNALSSDCLQRCWLRTAALRPIAPALLRLHDKLAMPTNNSELAGLCHMSEDHFIRRFREAVGISPAQYIIKRRIALAAQRLLFTGESIDEVAQSTGFSDRFYFSRVFARETGIPPAKYRNCPRT